MIDATATAATAATASANTARAAKSRAKEAEPPRQPTGETSARSAHGGKTALLPSQCLARPSALATSAVPILPGEPKDAQSLRSTSGPLEVILKEDIDLVLLLKEGSAHLSARGADLLDAKSIVGAVLLSVLILIETTNVVMAEDRAVREVTKNVTIEIIVIIVIAKEMLEVTETGLGRKIIEAEIIKRKNLEKMTAEGETIEIETTKGVKIESVAETAAKTGKKK